MVTYLIRRLLLFVPTLLGATFVIFMLMAASPSSIFTVLLPPGGELRPGERASREAYLQARYGLKDSALRQYFRWLNNISPVGIRTWAFDAPEVQDNVKEQTRRLMAGEKIDAIKLSPLPGQLRWKALPIKKPDLGNSFIQNRPVTQILKEAIPRTFILQAVALPITLTIALISGIYAARFRGGAIDWASGTILLALYSIPVIWAGVMFIGFLANVNYLKLFPIGGINDQQATAYQFFPSWSTGSFERGYLLDASWHLILPVVCIAYPGIAFYSKLTRTSLLETLSADFIRTARAKGLSERIVLFRHAFRNSLLPLITVAANFLPLLISGSIVIETIYNINGMGQLLVESLRGNDRELFLSASVLVLLLQLLGNLLADIAYVLADPRVSYE